MAPTQFVSVETKSCLLLVIYAVTWNHKEVCLLKCALQLMWGLHKDNIVICVGWVKGPCNVVLYAVMLGMRIICDICLNCVKAVERHLKLDSDHLCLSTPDVRIW